MPVYEKWKTVKYGAFTVGKDDVGYDVILYGATSGNYLHWDESGDDLLLVGTATQLAVAGDTDSTTTTSGSLRTAGGLGVAKAVFIGTTLNVAGASTLTGAVGVAGKITATSTTSLSFNPTLVPDETRTNYIWSYGTRATAKNLAMAASTNYNLDPIQINIAITGTAPTSSTVNLSYMKIAHTIDMTALRLKCSDWNIAIANNILDAYVYQGEIDITASTAIGNEATALGLTVNVSAGTVTGKIRGVTIAMMGASMPATTSIGLNIDASGANMTLCDGIRLEVGSTATMTNGLRMLGTMTQIFNFTGIVTAVSEDNLAAPNKAGSIAILTPAGAVAYINYYDGTRA